MRIVIKILLVLGLVIAAGYGVVWWWGSRSAAPAAAPTAVRVEPAARGTLTEYISAPGEIEPRAKVAISARVSARIIELPYKEGDRVTRGNPNAKPPIPPSVLVKLDAKDLESALKSAQARQAAEEAQLTVSKARVASTRARLEALRVTLADARRELERNRKLLTSRDVSQNAVDQLQARVDQQEAEIASAIEGLKGDEAGLVVLKHNIEAASAEIEKARENLSYAVITAPIDGVVTRLASEVGEMVVIGTMNNAGTMIMEVADLSQMVVKARVDENAIAQVKIGQKCAIRCEAYRDQVFEGTVTNVALANFDPQYARGASMTGRNAAMSEGRYFKVEILLDSKGQKIFSGLSADIDIQTNRYDDIIKVPSQCVLGRAPDILPAEARSRPEVDTAKATVPVVFRFVDGQAVVTPVTIGASDLTHTVIKAGLSAGDLVITGPYKVLESMQHNQKVKNDREKAGAATTRSAATTQSTATKPTAR